MARTHRLIVLGNPDQGQADEENTMASAPTDLPTSADVPPSITDAWPRLKLVASVLMTRTSDVAPGWMGFVRLKSNPTTLPVLLRSLRSRF